MSEESSDTRAHIFVRAHDTQRKHNQISKQSLLGSKTTSTVGSDGAGYENNFDLITKIYCLKKYSSSIIHLPKSFPSRAFAQRLQWMWGCSREVGETGNILRHISSESEK